MAESPDDNARPVAATAVTAPTIQEAHLLFQLSDVAEAFTVSEDENLNEHGDVDAAPARLDHVSGSDPAERMMAVQTLALHDVTMASLARVAEMRRDPRYQSNYVMDAVRLARASVRQMEALARLKAQRRTAGAATLANVSMADISPATAETPAPLSLEPPQT